MEGCRFAFYTEGVLLSLFFSTFADFSPLNIGTALQSLTDEYKTTFWVLLNN